MFVLFSPSLSLSLSLSLYTLEVGGVRPTGKSISVSFFVYVPCVRAKLCARIRPWLGAAKLFSPAPPPAAVGACTSRGTLRGTRGTSHGTYLRGGASRAGDVARDVPAGRCVLDVAQQVPRDVLRNVCMSLYSEHLFMIFR